jgi:hypothetical protein
MDSDRGFLAPQAATTDLKAARVLADERRFPYFTLFASKPK